MYMYGTCLYCTWWRHIDQIVVCNRESSLYSSMFWIHTCCNIISMLLLSTCSTIIHQIHFICIYNLRVNLWLWVKFSGRWPLTSGLSKLLSRTWVLPEINAVVLNLSSLSAALPHNKVMLKKNKTTYLSELKLMATKGQNLWFNTQKHCYDLLVRKAV